MAGISPGTISGISRGTMSGINPGTMCGIRPGIISGRSRSTMCGIRPSAVLGINPGPKSGINSSRMSGTRPGGTSPSGKSRYLPRRHVLIIPGMTIITLGIIAEPSHHQAEHAAAGPGRHAGLDDLIAKHAAANNLPLALVHRVVKRESDYNPRCIYAGNYGLMQIRLGTARSLGYTGTVEGLLDPDTNMTYAVRYLAGAYRVAGGDEDRAVALYARGYNSNSGRASVRRPTRFAAFWSGLASRW